MSLFLFRSQNIRKSSELTSLSLTDHDYESLSQLPRIEGLSRRLSSAGNWDLMQFGPNASPASERRFGEAPGDQTSKTTGLSSSGYIDSDMKLEQQ